MARNKKLSHDETLQAHRETITMSLTEIASDIHSALLSSGLDFPVYIAVPSAGDALVTVASPVDPVGDEWSRAVAIVQEIVGEKTGVMALRARELACIMVGKPMGASDVTVC